MTYKTNQQENTYEYLPANHLNLHIDSKDAHITHSIDELSKDIGLRRIEARTSLKVILLSLFWSDTGRLITPRNKEPFGPMRYNPHKIGPASFITALDKLVEHEYVIQTLGFKDVINNASAKTTIVATPKLTEYLHNNKWSHQDGCIYKSTPELVLLRDNSKKKKLIDYKDSRSSNWLRGELTKYNNLLNNSEILLVKYNSTGEEDIVKEYHSLTLARKFIQHNPRGSDYDVELSYGGRMYAPWCNLNSEQRKMITINGEKTVELDLQASSINVIYIAKTGVRYPGGDPYNVSVGDKLITRHIVKQAATIMLNTKNIQGAVAALEEHYLPNVFNDKRSKKNLKKASEYELMKLTVKPSEVMKAFLEKHKTIENSFLKGKRMGDLVACQESDRVFEIVRRFTKNNVPILTVYDSFIVQEQYKDNLQRWMDTLLPLMYK